MRYSVSRKIFLLFFTLGLFLLPSVIHAFEFDTVYKAKVLESKIVGCDDFTNIEEYKCVEYTLEILNEDRKGEVVNTMPTWLNRSDEVFPEGIKVYIAQSVGYGVESTWSIQSPSREVPLLILLVIFVVIIIAVAGWKGVRSTLGLSISFLVLYFYAVPNIIGGENLLVIAVVTTLVLMFSATFITYGFNIKSLIAFSSTLLGVIIITTMGYLIVRLLNISGMGDEYSAMLSDSMQGMIRMSSIFLFSIIIGAMGVLDDVTIGQTSSMIEIYNTDKTLKPKELFKKTMNIGKDHIASMVNTLFIAYAGSSFALIILLSANNPNFNVLINTGFIVEEIIRTLVASIGLILVVPLTSFISSRAIVRFLK